MAVLADVRVDDTVTDAVDGEVGSDANTPAVTVRRPDIGDHPGRPRVWVFRVSSAGQQRIDTLLQKEPIVLH
ncbi:hypothetical protein GCM10020255_008340 [Rhodococcus baikonurensis]